MTPEDAVETIFLGESMEAFNITFNGDSEQIGSFNGENSNIGIGNGVVIASGDVIVTVGPNDIGSAAAGVGNFGATDPDLKQLIPGFGLNDAAALEFDFIAAGDSVSFQYVWGSEEYPEFVNSSFIDVFGFFLSGPGISGPYSLNAINIALVPGTALPVTIDNVNQIVNDQYYIDNFDAGANATQLDGFTTVLTAEAGGLQCGETYHVKMALADAGDTAYDSAVFLKGGSFVSNYDLTALCEGGLCPLLEGCADTSACNYDPQAQCDDGTCVYPDGCTDPVACNYNPNATCDDGSCLMLPTLMIVGSSMPLQGALSSYGVTPNLSGASYLWELSPPEIGTVNTPDAQFTTVSFSTSVSGAGQICVEVNVNNICIEEVCQLIELQGTSIHETGNLFQGVHLFPNPVSNVLVLDLPEHLGLVNVVLLDVTGRLVLQEVLQGRQSFDMTGQSSGLYTLLLHVGSEYSSFRVIKC